MAGKMGLTGPAHRGVTRAVLANGPEFAAKMMAIDLLLSRVIAKDAIKAGADVIAEEWRRLVPYFEGHYQRSITVKTSSRSLPGIDSEDLRRLAGAAAVIYPGVVPGVPDDEQPFRYASVLEYGGTLGDKQGNAKIPAFRPARTAFYAKVDEAVDAVGHRIAMAL